MKPLTSTRLQVEDLVKSRQFFQEMLQHIIYIAYKLIDSEDLWQIVYVKKMNISIAKQNQR